VRDAKFVINEACDQLESKRAGTLYFQCGRGTHSVGKAKLPDACRQVLEARPRLYAVEQDRGAVFVVRMR